MIDALADGLRAAAGGSAWSAPLVFAAGTLTSAGPCVAPRYVAVVALAGNARRPWLTAAAFALGVVAAYVTLGTMLGAIATLAAWSSHVYAVLAVVLLSAGVFVLVRTPHACGRERDAAGPGAAFLLGATSSFVISPCCTPVIGAIAGLTALGGRAADGVLLLACFALGHVAPVFGAALAARWTKAAALRHVTALAARFEAAGASRIVSGALMVGLGLFYGVVA